MQDTNINNSLKELKRLLNADVLIQEDFENGQASLLSSSEEKDNNDSIHYDVEVKQNQVASTLNHPQSAELVSPTKKLSSLRFGGIYVLLLILLVVFLVNCNDNKSAATESTKNSKEMGEVEYDSFVDKAYNDVPKLLQLFRDANKNETLFCDFLSLPEVKSWIINTKSQAYYDKMNQLVCKNDPWKNHNTPNEIEGVYEYSCNIEGGRIKVTLEYNARNYVMSVSMKDRDIELDSNGDNPVIKEITAKAIPFRDVIDAFNNPIKAEQTLIGKTLYIKAEIDEIVRINNENYKYLLKSDYSWTGRKHLQIYTNDEQFVTFDYPKTIIIQAYFRNRYVSRDFFTGDVDEIFFYFLDGKAMLWYD